MKDYRKPGPARIKARRERICLLRSKLREAERSLRRAAVRYVKAGPVHGSFVTAQGAVRYKADRSLQRAAVRYVRAEKALEKARRA